MLGPGLVRAGQHAAPAGELSPRDPGLLPVDHELVAALLRPRSQRREVRPRVRLGEALAPDLLGREDGRDVAAALLVGAEAQQRGPEHVEADDVGELGGSGCRQLLVDHDLLGRGASAAAELQRPRSPDVARLMASCLPRPEGVHPGLEGARQARCVGALGGEEGADLVLELALRIGRCQPHELRSYQFSPSAAQAICSSNLHLS